MGKGMLFLVLASTYILTQINSSEIEAEMATEEVRTEYAETVLARELAHSAFNLVVSRTSQDFSRYRAEDAEKAYGDGMFAYTVTGDRRGPVQLSAYGEVGSSVHLIQATLVRSGTPILDAMTVDGPMSSVTTRGSSYVISGLDEPASDEDLEGGNGADGHAVRAVLDSSKDAFNEAINGDRLVGKSGNADVVSGEPIVDLAELELAIVNYENVITLEGSQRISGTDIYGSAENPVVMVINGDLNVSGTVSGFGVLYVKGSLANAGNIRWEGLVVLSSDGGDHEFKGTTDIYGGLVLRSLTSEGETGGYEDAGMPNGHFDVDVFSAARELTYHQHQYDDRYDVTGIDLMKDSCEIEGGLCWDQQVIDSGLENVRVVLENTDGNTGSFRLQTVNALFTGPVEVGFSHDVVLADLEALNITFYEACGVKATAPGEVWADQTNRNGQLTFKVYDIRPEDSGASPILIHEVVVYRHSTTNECSSVESHAVDVEPISFYINGDVGIHSSASALRRLEGLLPILEAPPVEITMTEVRQNSARSGL